MLFRSSASVHSLRAVCPFAEQSLFLASLSDKLNAIVMRRAALLAALFSLSCRHLDCQDNNGIALWFSLSPEDLHFAMHCESVSTRAFIFAMHLRGTLPGGIPELICSGDGLHWRPVTEGGFVALDGDFMGRGEGIRRARF